MPDIPGGLFPWKRMLEFDTNPKNIFITNLIEEDFSVFDQVKTNGHAKAPEGHGIGITPKKDFIKKFKI